MRTVMVLVVMLAGSPAFAQPPGKNDPPKPLSGEVLKAWTAAGVTVAWKPDGRYGFTTLDAKPPPGVAAVVFAKWKDGVIGKLPAPDVPFALALTGTAVTDAGLKELAHLKSLTTLYLYNTAVTDAGLKELAAFDNLVALDLGRTAITDAGLKELAQLKRLTALHLLGAKVSKDAVAELRKALPKCQISGP